MHIVNFVEDLRNRQQLSDIWLNKSASTLVIYRAFQGLGKLVFGHMADCTTTLFALSWLYQLGPLFKGVLISLMPVATHGLDPNNPYGGLRDGKVVMALCALLGLADSTQYALFPFMTMAVRFFRLRLVHYLQYRTFILFIIIADSLIVLTWDALIGTGLDL